MNKLSENVEVTDMSREGKKIHLRFHPNNYENLGHAIEKADSEGKQRKYLCGISSGLDVDAHGERMSQKAVNSFLEQANQGDVLLFPDVHGVKESEDIGLLTKAEILTNGDWYTEYRLYDEGDGIGANKAEKIDTIWKQMLGLPPYKQPKQKGFSIEGIIPDQDIKVKSDGTIDRRIIDNILLDGVVLVPRPAYKNSVAIAICKALGETSPQRKLSLENSLKESLEKDDIRDKFYKLKWDYQNALEEVLERIMKRANNNKEDELNIVFDEYKNLMIPLVLSSEKVFTENTEEFLEEPSPYLLGDQEEVEQPDQVMELFKSLRSKLVTLVKKMETGEKNEYKSK